MTAPRPQAASLQGRALLEDIQSASAKLPFRSLLAMALGGLRVRLTRSLVTTLSVVLAIAFLTYMSLSNQVEQSLASTLASKLIFRFVFPASLALTRQRLADWSATLLDPLRGRYTWWSIEADTPAGIARVARGRLRLAFRLQPWRRRRALRAWLGIDARGDRLVQMLALGPGAELDDLLTIAAEGLSGCEGDSRVKFTHADVLRPQP